MLFGGLYAVWHPLREAVAILFVHDVHVVHHVYDS